MLDRDRMNSVPVVAAARASIAVIDAIQHMPREQQLLGVASVFKLMTERFGIEPQDVMTATGNVMNTATGKRVEFEAVRAYLANEV